MLGRIYSQTFLVSILVCSFSQEKAFAWPAVIAAPESRIEKVSVKSESKITRGIQKTLAEGHYRVGLRLKKKKQWEEALTQFLEATNKNPNHFKSFFEQALIYRQKQLHDMALTCLQQALTIKPKFKDARVLFAALQLERGNVGIAFEQLKESLGIKPNASPSENQSESKEKVGDSAKDSDTILQTIHTFIETTQTMANVVAQAEPVLDAAPPVSAPFVSAPPVSAPLVSAPFVSTASVTESQVSKQPDSKLQEVLKDSSQSPVLMARQPQLAVKSIVKSKTKEKAKAKIDQTPKGDEWTRKLSFLARNGTGTLKNGEAFLFSEDTGEAILILADGRRIVRTVEEPKDQQTIVQIRRPDMLVPDDLLYNLSLLGKVVADAVTPRLDPAPDSKPTSNSSSPIEAPASKEEPKTIISQPPSFKLESGQSESLVDSLEPKKMVHWLKDVLHL